MLVSLLIDTRHRKAPRDQSLRARVRVEQLDVTLRLVPFTVLVSLSVVQVIIYLFWSPEKRLYLSLLETGIMTLALFGLKQCWQWRSRAEQRQVSGHFIQGVTAASLLYGSLLASIPVMLFVDADDQQRLVIAASCAGLIATGMSAAVMPRAAISYSGPIIVGSMLALFMTGETFYVNVAILLFFYAVFVIFTILHFSHLLTLRVMAQADLERQQELTSLLLNDFEENASDWLWETDRELRLQHVSARLVQVAGSTEERLQGLPLEQLILQPPGGGDTTDTGTALWRHIRDRQGFRDQVVPLPVAGEPRWWCLSGKPIFDRDGAFTGYRGVGSDVTEKKRSAERLSYLAMHDSLTELHNRASFQHALDAARDRIPHGEQFALLCLDLDEFKCVNDTFGHGAGDALLRAVADRLQLQLEPGMLLARLAGDEFAILVCGQPVLVPRALEALASRLIDAVSAPFHIDTIRMSVGVSIGIAIAPQDGDQEIMRRADLALYRMKKEGRNGYRFYRAEMDEKVEARRVLTADLRNALSCGEFELHFQPLVGAGDGRIQGFETLLRWKHPARGYIPPGEFIPLAEEVGVIIPLGEWIIQEACRIAAAWPAEYSVAVNLSPIQFRHSDLLAVIRRALAESQLDPCRLELEVTESVFLEATPAVHSLLENLCRMRVRLSLDDFGTGYSSLSYLRRIPFDKIKIDQSFVRDLPQEKSDLAIVRAIVEMAKTLGMTITAEGVETEAQRRCLEQLGCDQIQGYLFSRPMSAEQACALVGCGQVTLGAQPYAA